LSDTDKKIGIAYGAAADANAQAPMRISYLIGADGRVERAYGKVKAAEHPEQALGELRDKL
jgi:peroxiredoxin